MPFLEDDIRDLLVLARHLGGCSGCREEHGEYPESVSCYCECHCGCKERWAQLRERWPQLEERYAALLTK